MPANVLLLTHEPPLPLTSGARLRSYHLMRELARRGHRISLFALSSEGEPPADARQGLADLCERVEVWPLSISKLRRWPRLAADYARRQPFQRRYFFSRAGADAAARLVDEVRPEAIVVGQLYMEPYLPDLPATQAILDSHNAEAHRIETMARGGGPRATMARRQRGPVAAHEAAVSARFGRIWTVSEEEREYFETLAPGRVDVVPNGVDAAHLPMRSLPSPGREVLFLGRMDYGPNVEGARRLLEDVLPRLRDHEVSVRIVGANPPPLLRRAAKRSAAAVEVTGFVSDVDPYLQSARMLAVYLHAGGGTRLKILQALARGVPVISTSLGAEGLGLEHGREVLIADDPATFARCIERLLDDDDLCASLARHARATVVNRFDWSVIGHAADASLQKLLTGGEPRSEPVRA